MAVLLLKVGVGLQVSTDGFAHHGVLAHEHDGTPTQGHADLLHLLGAHIVGTHDEATAVLVKQLGYLGKVVSFPSWLVHPNHLEPWIKAPFFTDLGTAMKGLRKLVSHVTIYNIRHGLS